MKWDDEQIGGIETEPVRFRYPGGNKTQCQLYIRHGRGLLGSLKQQMQKDGVGFAKTNLTLPNGVKLHAQSNMIGAADIDEIWIDTSSLKEEAKDRCTGFIIRIKTTDQYKLGIHVKEPGETTDINTYIDSFNQKKPKVYTNRGNTSQYGDPITLDDDNILYENLDAATGEDVNQYKKHTFKDVDWVYSGVSNTHTGFSGDLELIVIKVVNPPGVFTSPAFPWSHVTGESTTTITIDGDPYYSSTTGSPPTHGGTVDIDDRTRFGAGSVLNTGDWDAVWNLELAALALTETNTQYGVSPCLIIQNTSNPITRYFGANYDIDNGRIIVNHDQGVDGFTSFASVLPGKQKYAPRLYQSVYKNIGAGRYIMSGGQGYLTLLNQVVEPYPDLSTWYWYTVQESVDTELTVTDTIPEWTFYSKVKSGRYECTVTYSDQEDFGDVDVEIDVLLYGTDHFKTYQYTDRIVNRASTKKIIIDVGKEVDFIDGMKNPYIAIEDNL